LREGSYELRGCLIGCACRLGRVVGCGKRNKCINAFRYYCLLKLSAVIEIEQLSSAEREDHALVVFLEMIVNFGGNEGGEMAFGKGFIFVESFSVDSKGIND